MEFFKDLFKAKNEVLNEQEEKIAKKEETEKKIAELEKKCDLLGRNLEDLEKKRDAMLKHVPKDQKEWSEFDPLALEVVKAREKLDEAAMETWMLIAGKRPFDKKALEKRLGRALGDVMEKHSKNN